MSLLRNIVSGLRALILRKRVEREMDEELRAYLEMAVEEKMQQGMSRREAARVVRLERGSLDGAKETVRAAGWESFVETWWKDLRFALRMLRKNPGFTSVAVLTLALGIGVNTATFSAFDALVLRPRAVADPDRLAFVFRVTSDDPRGRFSYPDYLYYRDHSKSFSDFGLFASGMAVTSSDLPASGSVATSGAANAVGFYLPQLLQGGAQPMMCFFVSGNYFPMLGAVPLQGRLIEPEDDGPGASPAVVMSGNFWQQQFHSDPKVLGSVVHLNGTPFTIVGITSADYKGTAPDVPNLWAPVAAKLRLGDMSPQELVNRHVIVGEPQGRLKPGVSFADAQAELGVLEAQLRAAHPEDQNNERISVLPGRNDLALLEPMEWALIAGAMIAVALLLLIASANVASLMLAKAAARRREIAVRLALGVGRWRLLRQLLTESVVLGVLAGVVGLPFASWMLHLLVVEIASVVPPFWGTITLPTAPDVGIFAYTLAISCATGVVFGLAPALQAAKVDVNAAIKGEGSALGLLSGRGRLRGLLITSQMAACLLLLINSALLLRGSQRALRIDPGYETKHIAYFEMYNPAKLHYPPERLLQLNRELIRRMEAIPGVQSVAQASRGPIGNMRWVDFAPVDTDRTPAARPKEAFGTGYSYVTPNYFETMGIPMLRGRVFTRDEAEGQAPVVVISEATARRFWPNENPIGKRLRIGSDTPGMSFPGEVDPFIPSSEVIGVAGDVRSMDLTKVDESYIYLPLSQTRQWTSVLLARTGGDPALLLPTMGNEVRREDANLPVLGAPLTAMLSTDPHFVISRVGGVLASIIGGLGLLLACMGVYGMVSYSVAQRTREIGVRMALGAQRMQVLRLVMIEGLRPILLGMVIGVVGSAGLSRLVAATLFGLSPVDGISFTVVSLLLGAIALLATYMPARKAMRVDPMVALRYE
jgi:macrolide transport system ATP-binding/permease protein